MLSEKGRNRIQKMLRVTGFAFSSKRNELNKLTTEGQDKVSVFMNPGELPPEFNDHNLNARDHSLFTYETELNNIQLAHSNTVGQIGIDIEETYIKKMSDQLIELEEKIAKI